MVTKRFSGAFSQRNFSQKHLQLHEHHCSKHTNELHHPTFQKQNFTASWSMFKVLFTNYRQRETREEAFIDIGVDSDTNFMGAVQHHCLSCLTDHLLLLMERLNPIKLSYFLIIIPPSPGIYPAAGLDQNMTHGSHVGQLWFCTETQSSSYKM